MGCDIHMFVEVRNTHTGVWDFIPPEGNAPRSEWQEKFKLWNWCTGRNYTLFGILAGVRCADYVPIAEPRGVPEDASPGYKAEFEKYGVDAHTPSWVTVAEVDAYDWGQNRQVLVSTPPGVYALKMAGKSWFGEWRYMNNVGEVENVDPETMEKYLGSLSFKAWVDSLGLGYRYPEEIPVYEKVHLEMRAKWNPRDEDFSPGKGYLAQAVHYTTPLDECSGFRKQTLPALRELGDPEDVRIVFFFDN